MKIARLVFALAAAVLLAAPVLAAEPPPAPAPASAADQAAVMATVHQFMDAFNKGDEKTMLAACAAQASIVDEIPPHEWEGANACAAWAKDYKANAEEAGITDAVVTLGVPKHVDIEGNRAYVVTPASFTFKVQGYATGENASLFTVALEKFPEGWRITGWTWTKI